MNGKKAPVKVCKINFICIPPDIFVSFGDHFVEDLAVLFLLLYLEGFLVFSNKQDDGF